MNAPSPLDLVHLFKPLVTRRALVGCGGLLLGALALGALLQSRLARPPLDELWLVRWVLCVMAAFWLLVALRSLWALLRSAMGQAPAAPAAAPARVWRRGRVVAEGEALRAPISGTPCVAWAYRVGRERWIEGARSIDVMYAGVGGIAFRLEGADGHTPVRVVPALLDPLQAQTDDQALARLRRHVASARFEESRLVEDGLALTAQLLSQSVHQPVQPGEVFRRDWTNPALTGQDLRGLDVAEVVLPVGAQACVVGHGSPERQAIEPSHTVTEPALAAATEQGLEAMQRALGDTGGAPGEPPPSPAAAAALSALLSTVLAAGLLGVALLVSAQGS